MWQLAPSPTSRETSAPHRYQRVKAELHRQLVEAMDLTQLARWTTERLLQEVQALAHRLAERLEVPLPDTDASQLAQELLDEVFGLGPLQKLLHDPLVSDVLVNGPGSVYVERLGRLELTDVKFADDAHLVRVIQRIASRVGRTISESSPMVDARLPDGSRVNAVIPPLVLDGPTLSIRRFKQRLGADDLVGNQTLTSEMLEFLAAAVAGKTNILISGGTGAGKTTLLNALSAFIPPGERLITVEDAAELILRQPHVIRMETRPANLEGAGEVTQRQLVRNSLRMRPDRIIVGEVRGPEAMDMLQAMNTGHEGSLTTIHANGTRDALSRLEIMASMAGLQIPVATLQTYIATAITLIVQVDRIAGGCRKVSRVSELRRLRRGRRYEVRDLFTFAQTDVVEGSAVGYFTATGYVPRLFDKLAAAGRRLSPDLFAARTLDGALSTTLDRQMSHAR